MARGPATVAIVEDEPLLAEAISDLLSWELECRVVGCSTGDQAVDLVATERPDLVILDLVLPGMSGTTVLRSLKTNPELRPIPVVICTAAQLTRESQQRILDDGAGAIIPKPFDLDDLLNCVQGLLANPQGTCENELEVTRPTLA